MKKRIRLTAILGGISLLLFSALVILLKFVDVRAIGPDESSVGLSGINSFFAELFPYNEAWFDITDPTILIGILTALFFAGLGFYQLTARKSLANVDRDIIVLGAVYAAVVLAYIAFNVFSLNSRPVIIDSVLEPSFPSTHTMVIVTITGTAMHQIYTRIKDRTFRYVLLSLSSVFTVFSVVSRIVTGVHWITDIIAAILLSVFFICAYLTACECVKQKKNE